MGALEEGALAEAAGALAAELREPPKGVWEEFAGVWAAVAGHTFDFAGEEAAAAAVEGVGVAGLRGAWAALEAAPRVRVEVAGSSEA